MQDKPKVLMIVGPTASGKTSLSVQLAKQFNGEVISADSRQVYKGLDIGTGKVTTEEMQGIPHHLLDVADLKKQYTVTDFVRDGRAAIADILSRGKLPVIVGGTFFYVDALIGRVSTPPVPPNPELRAKLETMQADALYNALLKLDERRATDIDPENKRRLIRALEIIAASGAVPEQKSELMYQPLVLGISVERDALRQKFRARAETWLAQGLVDEVKHLLAKGITRERLEEIGFEYTLVLDLIDENISESEYLDRFEQKNWQYAKRQLTWLKRDKEIHWIDPKEYEKIVQLVHDFLNNED